MLFIFIKDCRMFQEQLIPLHPQYDVHQAEDRFIVVKNEDYSDLTTPYRLNILALCGRNGVGKSTFLQLLSGDIGSQSDFTLCWIDSKGEIASNRQTKLKFCGKKIQFLAKVHNYSLRILCGNDNIREENTVRRSLLEVYSAKPEVFKLHDRDIFDGFHLDFDRQYSDIHELEKNVSTHLGINSTRGGFTKMIEKRPLFHLLALLAQDSAFKGLIERHLASRRITCETLYRWLRDNESQEIESDILKMVYHGGDKGESFRQEKSSDSMLKFTYLAHSDPSWQLYSPSEYFKVQDELKDLSDRADDWIKRKLKNLTAFFLEEEGLNLAVEKGWLQNLLIFRPFQRHGDQICHFEDLSSGEKHQIKLLFELAPKIMPVRACWFFDDDLDEFFHPEWKRNLVNRLLKTYREFTKRISKSTGNKLYEERISTCLIATHSPFVLSDLPKECVLQFIKASNGKTTVNRATEDTFAGNIGELFHTEFFMKATIGEFARQRIETALKSLKNKPSKKQIEDAKKLFENVGDEVLKNLLLEKVSNAKN